MVQFLEDLFFSKVAPTEKMRASGLRVSEPGGCVCILGWQLILKFHRVFSSYGVIPAFAQGDQFHRLPARDS